MRFARIWIGAAIAAVALPLAGCDHVPDAVNPVAWYHEATDTSNPEDVNQRNQQNLEAGTKQPYPNLATVPNAPNTATGTIDRDKLMQGLVADRTNAKYNNEQLQAGSQLASIAPPPPPPAKLNPPTAATVAPSAPASSATPATPAPAAAANNASPHQATGTRGQEPPPAESTLTSPTIPNTPQGQVPPPPPPPAQVARTSPPPPPTVAPVAPSSSAAAPQLTPPAGVRAGGQPALAMRTPSKTQNPVSVSVGDVAFAQGSSDLAETQRSALADIASLYKRTGGEIRIVGHSEPGHSNDAIRQRIAALDLALDRANAVAQALTKMGVPAHDIRVEAAPANSQDQPRAEVFMEY